METSSILARKDSGFYHLDIYRGFINLLVPVNLLIFYKQSRITMKFCCAAVTDNQGSKIILKYLLLLCQT